MEYRAYYDSPLGSILLTSDGEALTGLWFEGQLEYAERSARREPVQECEAEEPEAIRGARRWLDQYFRGEIPDFMPTVRPEGTKCQKTVWKILLTIPYGQTVSYGTIASRIAAEWGIKRMSAQAVGGAVGHNPVSLIIPCHRVIGTDGSMVGYGGGLDRKIWLLRHEAETVQGQKSGNPLTEI